MTGPSVDTIAAISTAPGRGAVSLVRVSGPGSRNVLAAVVPGVPGPPPPRQVVLATVRDPATGDSLDRVLVTFFPGPDSYTGEDMLELSGHGGFLAPRLVLDACLQAGARMAEPGEFTRRAYLNGKLDLLQAEATADLVEGRSRALHGAALHQLERGLSLRVAEIREGLVHLEALLAHHLDFPEEDDAPTPPAAIAAEARALEDTLARLLETAPEGELLREGALAVLAGRPNSGKSSLFNALLGQERAIVTDEPGTTRDALEAGVSIGGFPFRLVDTAGLRETQGTVERLGIEVARRYLGQADVVLFCVEAGREPGEDERAFLAERKAPVVLVRTKADLHDEDGSSGDPWPPAQAEEEGPAGHLRFSVLSGEGMRELQELLPGLVYRGLVRLGAQAPILTRARQARAVARARDDVGRFAQAVEDGISLEVAATHLRPAETALEELLGIVTREEVLDHLFSTFCVGK